MKILYLDLINSAGIMAGMFKKEIEISFLNNDNKIVMLFGGNGSGKSTILSALHPFTGTTNDSRDNFFIEGKAGEKIIHYKDNDVVYIIHHYVSAKKKTRSYFSKMLYSDYINSINKLSMKQKNIEGEELNENGGVKTFNQLVLDYLGIDEEFFKISRIGSNVTNFIDLSTANRKKYISLFLPDIDEYLAKYKVVNDKFRALNKKIKFVADEITKIKPMNELLNDKSDIEGIINQIQSKIDKLKAAINK
jgi:DNA repair exonuclease SbcCD ATPase subunit